MMHTPTCRENQTHKINKLLKIELLCLFLLFTRETEIIKLPSNGKAVGELALGKNIKVGIVEGRCPRREHPGDTGSKDWSWRSAWAGGARVRIPDADGGKTKDHRQS